MAPAKTPDSILEKLHDEVKRIVTSPELTERLRVNGIEEIVTSRKEHAATLKRDIETYRALIRDLKLTLAN
jgi:tripartite-type tricarboxylate transporter receptor subunit TctC